MDGARGRLKGQVRPKHTVFNHVQQEGCRAHLEVGRDLRHIRVPDHDVEPPIPRRISQRLISRVDDGVWSCCALEHRSLTALRQAVLDAITRLVRVPRPSEYLARDEERDKGRRQACEIDAPHKVVLVAAVVIPRTIRIVFEEAYLCRHTFVTQALLCLLDALLKNPLACLVVGHEVHDVIALRGRILRVITAIQVKPGAIFEKAIGVAEVGRPEQMSDDAECGFRRQAPARTDLGRQTIFGLYAKDPRLHRLSTLVRLASTL